MTIKFKDVAVGQRFKYDGITRIKISSLPDDYFMSDGYNCMGEESTYDDLYTMDDEDLVTVIKEDK